LAILNYSTTIDVHKTISEIQKQLSSHGANKIMMEYKDGQITQLSFSINGPSGDIGIVLPAKADCVFRIMEREKKNGKIKTPVSKDQAERVAWRNIKDWIEAQMALLETEMVELEQIFLPYMISEKGMTVYDKYKQNLLMLEGGLNGKIT